MFCSSFIPSITLQEYIGDTLPFLRFKGGRVADRHGDFPRGVEGAFQGGFRPAPRAPFPAHRDFECGWRIGDLDAETSHLPGCRKTKLVVVVVEEMEVVVISSYQEPGNFSMYNTIPSVRLKAAICNGSSRE